MAKPQSAVGYVRTTGGESDDIGAAIASQRREIRAHCARRGRPLIDIHVDVEDGSPAPRGDGLAAALAVVRAGAAGALVVARVACLGRSVGQVSRTLELARSEGWNLVILDLGVDLATVSGMAMARMTALFAEVDRRLSSERSRAGLEARRLRGERLGRPPAVGEQVRGRIREERMAGRSLRAIARGLDSDGVPTGHGGARWHASTVRSMLAHPT